MFVIDTTSREPIYTQIEKNIVKYVNLGIYEAGEMLPSVRALATQLGINPNTVAKAYKNLEQMGVLYTLPGKGIYVSSKQLDEVMLLAREHLRGALSDAKNAGVSKETLLEMIDELWRDGK